MTRAAKTATAPRRKAPRGVPFAAVCKLASALPGVEQGMSYGTPGLKVKGRFLARLKEDGESLVLRIGFRKREELLEKSPDVFYITDHYLNYPSVLIRLPKVRKDVLARLLKDAWCEVAPEVSSSEAKPGARRRTASKGRTKRK